MKRKFDTQAQAGTFEKPPAHVHHHTPSEATPILAKAGVGVLGLIVFWLFGLFLLSQMGVHKPAETLAHLIVYGCLLIGGAWWVDRLVRHYVERYFAHKETIEQERTQQMRYKQVLTHSAVTDSRREGDDKRLASLIYLILLDAYDYYAKHGPYRGAWRPWSRRPAGEYVLLTLGEQQPVGPEFGAKVRGFLEKHEIIVSDQLNLERYPDIASVQRVLYTPILTKGEGGQKQLNAGNWSHIE